MKSNIRKVAVVSSLAGLWCVSIVRGNNLLGREGIPLFVLASGGAIVLLGRMLLGWNRYTLFSRLVMCGVVAVVGYSIVFPSHVMRDYAFFAETQRHCRRAAALQRELSADAKYRFVSVTYIDPFPGKGEWLEVQGRVPNEMAKAELVRIVEQADSWHVKWNVSIGSG